MRDWTLEADEVLALPLDELALLVLQDADANREWNWHNWLNSARLGYGRRGDALQALSEAWGWLQSHDLIAWKVDQGAPGSFEITRLGRKVLDEGLPLLRAVHRLDVALVPELEHSARPQFLRGDFETAAFVAMKQVEVAVRERSGLGADLVGVPLMRQAFRPPKNDEDEGGPLFDASVQKAEATAAMELFAGAIGVFKNPSSHRIVRFDGPTLAAEVVLLADLLLRILNRRGAGDGS